MSGQTVGYIRVSTVDQNLARQEDSMARTGAVRIFQDKASGKDRKRPGLEECLKYLREGDTLVVHAIDRLARSLQDLQGLVQELAAKGVAVEFIKERLRFDPDDQAAPMDKLLFQVLGAFAEFERQMIRERQREGIKAAQDKGVQIGRPVALSKEQAAEAKARLAAGEKPGAIGKEWGVSRQTVTRAAAKA